MIVRLYWSRQKQSLFVRFRWVVACRGMCFGGAVRWAGSFSLFFFGQWLASLPPWVFDAFGRHYLLPSRSVLSPPSSVHRCRQRAGRTVDCHGSSPLASPSRTCIGMHNVPCPHRPQRTQEDKCGLITHGYFLLAFRAISVAKKHILTTRLK